MLNFGTLKRSRPMSNTERQRLFRERHPGYYGRLHRKRKAQIEAALAAQRAMIPATPARTPLLLPAPAPQLGQFMLFDLIQRNRERELVQIKREDELHRQ